MLWRAGGIALGVVAGVLLFQPVALVALVGDEDASELAWYLAAFAAGGGAAGYVAGDTLRRKLDDFRIKRLFRGYEEKTLDKS